MFGEGQYKPATDEGRRLMAHELTHTVQQGASKPQIRRSFWTSLYYLIFGNPFAEALGKALDVSPMGISDAKTILEYANMWSSLAHRLANSKILGIYENARRTGKLYEFDEFIQQRTGAFGASEAVVRVFILGNSGHELASTLMFLNLKDKHLEKLGKYSFEDLLREWLAFSQNEKIQARADMLSAKANFREFELRMFNINNKQIVKVQTE